MAYNAATLGGTINPNGLATTYCFQYGSTASYGIATAMQSAGDGTSAMLVNASITGLTATTTYHYQLLAINTSGTIYGLDQTFTTASLPGPVTTWTTTNGLTYTTANNQISIIGYSGTGGAVSIPSSINDLPVTSIADYAFYWCGSLTGMTIPNGVTSIGADAFSDCNKLTSVTIPNSVISIGAAAFNWCTGLTGVTIPNGVTAIEDSAFSNCTHLTSVTIPNGVTSIGKNAFLDCNSLASVTIPNSVTSIGENAFYSTSLASVTIPDSVSTIGAGAFSGCAVTSVVIPNSVTSIGDGVFSNCSNLTSVTIPNSVTSIGGFAFYNCERLPNVTIPNSVTSVGDYAFLVFGIGSSSLYNLTSIAVDPSNPSYSSSPDGVFFNKAQTTLIQYPGGKYGGYTIPSSVTSIKAGAFSYSSLTGISIPNSVASIGDDTFSYCECLRNVMIPNCIIGIGSRAFDDCRNLTSVVISGSVTSIGEEAFANCPSLTSAYFMGNAPVMGKVVFDFTPITVYYFNGETGFASPTWTDSSGDSYPADDLGPTSPPTISSGPATGTVFNGTTLSGTISPNGLPATCYFQYGTTTDYGNATAIQSAGSGTSATVVSASITGLTSATTYHYQLVLVSISGSNDYGPDQTFTTPNPPSTAPTVTTGSATGTIYNGTILSGTVNPNGSATICYFQYGPSLAYGNMSFAGIMGSSTSALSESASITGLSPATTYHYQLMAANTSGTVYGSDQTFTTANPPPPPVVTTGSAIETTTYWGLNYYTLNGTVNSSGADTTYYFQYGLTGTYGNTTSKQDAGSGTSSASVSAAIMGLTGSTTYHYQLVAFSIGGTSYGLDQTFTTGSYLPPTVNTGPATEPAFEEAILTGTVNPNGSATTVCFKYGTTTAYGFTTGTQAIGAGTGAIPCSAQIGSLESGTYHYCLVGVNANGTRDGADQTFVVSTKSDANLSALRLSAVVLSPTFSPSGTNYTVNVANNVTTTTVTATLETSGSIQMSLNEGAFSLLKSGKPSGAVKLQVGDNLIDVVVIASDRTTTETYSVTVNRATLPGAAAVQSGTAAGMANAKFVSFGNPVINDFGDVAFQALVSGTVSRSADYSAIFVESGSSGIPTEVASTSGTLDAAPDQSGTGIVGKFVTFGDPVFNNNSEVAFLGTLKSSGTVRVTAANDQGVWANTAGRLHLVARKGQTLSSGAKFALFSQLALPDSDGPVFLAHLAIGPGKVTSKNSEGIWATGTDGTPELLVGTGQPLAGGTIASLSIFAAPVGVAGQTRSFDSAGDLIFNATLTSGSQGVYIRMANGSISTVATKNEGTPGMMGMIFSGFNSPIVNNRSHAAFLATTSGTGMSPSGSAGIWAETGTGNQATLNEVVCKGNAAPSASGSLGASAGGTFSALGDPVYNDNDDVAFIGTLKISGTVTRLNNQGIWLWTGSTTALTQLARTQQLAAGCGGATFASFGVLALPYTGGVIVLASLSGPGVTPANNQGIWVIGTGQSALIARKGDVLVVDAQNHTKTIGALSIFTATMGAGAQTRSFNQAGDVIYKVTFTDGAQAIYKVVSP